MSTTTALRTDHYSKRVSWILQNTKQFEQHELTQELDEGLFRSWTCKRPGTWIYGFKIHTVPGWLFLTGDIGHLAISREMDMLPWTRRVVAGTSFDLHYLAQKTPNELVTKEFNHDLVLERFNEHMQEFTEIEYEDRLKIMADAAEATDEFSWNLFRWEHMGDEWMEWFESSEMDYSASLCWQVLALRRFFELLDGE